MSKEEVIRKLEGLLPRLPNYESEGRCLLDGTDCIPGESSCSATTCRTKAKWTIDEIDFLAERELRLLEEELDELRAGGS